MNKPKIQVKHKIEDLICFIEQNDIEKLKKIIEAEPRIVREKKMDDNEPIFYSIRYKNNKAFKIILENSENANYDVYILF